MSETWRLQLQSTGSGHGSGHALATHKVGKGPRNGVPGLKVNPAAAYKQVPGEPRCPCGSHVEGQLVPVALCRLDSSLNKITFKHYIRFIFPLNSEEVLNAFPPPLSFYGYI